MAAGCVPGLFFFWTWGSGERRVQGREQDTCRATVNAAYSNLINNIGTLVAFYYGAAGLACTWGFRRVMSQTHRFLVLGVVLPFPSGLLCFWVGYEVIVESGLTASASVLVTLG